MRPILGVLAIVVFRAFVACGSNDDAALTTARYLCASGSMSNPEGWREAVYSYNHDNDYVDKVARIANEYAASVID